MSHTWISHVHTGISHVTPVTIRVHHHKSPSQGSSPFPKMSSLLRENAYSYRAPLQKRPYDWRRLLTVARSYDYNSLQTHLYKPTASGAYRNINLSICHWWVVPHSQSFMSQRVMHHWSTQSRHVFINVMNTSMCCVHHIDQHNQDTPTRHLQWSHVWHRLFTGCNLTY